MLLDFNHGTTLEDPDPTDSDPAASPGRPPLPAEGFREPDRPRFVDALLPTLKQWHLRTGGAGLMFRPKHPPRGGRPDLGKASAFIRQHTLNSSLQKALKTLGLTEGGLNWYRCTRHTFASRWVMDGRSMERLRLILGHEDLSTTMRYAHLAPGSFSAADLAAVGVDLSAPAGKVIPLAAQAGADKVQFETENEIRRSGQRRGKRVSSENQSRPRSSGG